MEYTTLEKNILEFILNYSTRGRVQGTLDWKKGRTKVIGCSELSTAFGENIFQDIYDCLLSKFGMVVFDGNLYTVWGNVFEPVITSIVTYKTGTIIYAQNAYFMTDWGLACSPDGVAVVKDKASDDPNNEYSVTLFEFKCPLARNVQIGKVPANYIAQMQGGMNIISPTKFAIFAEGSFRRCKFSDLDWTNQCEREVINKDVDCMRKESRTTIPRCKPIALGLIFVFIKKESIPHLSKDYCDLLESEGFTCPADLGDELNDIGEMSSKLLYETFKLIVNSKILRSDYTQIFASDDIEKAEVIHGKESNSLESNKVHSKSKFTAKNIEKLISIQFNRAEKNGDVLFAMMPWKLFKFNMQRVEKDEAYIESKKPLITKLHKFMAECVDMDEEDKKIAMDEFVKEWRILISDDQICEDVDTLCDIMDNV